MRTGAGWISAGERGSLLAMRFAVWCYRLFGRRLIAFFILPLVSYFFLTDRKGRHASYRYLKRLYALPEGRQALGHPPRTWDCFLHYREFGLNILDRLVLWSGEGDQFEIIVHGREHFARLIEEKRGAILLGAHVGSFDALRVLAQKAGMPVKVVMFTQQAQKINRIFNELSPEMEMRVINLDPGSIQSVFDIKACVERGEFVALLGDRVGIGEHKRISWVPFLGAMAPFPRGPFLLASALQCAVVLMIGLRVNNTTYEAFAEPLADRVVLPRTTRDKTLDELVGNYAKRLEGYCFKAPYQWFNFYDFWGDDAGADSGRASFDSLAWSSAAGERDG